MRLSRSNLYSPTATITSRTEKFSNDSELYNNFSCTSTSQASLPPPRGRKRNLMSPSLSYSQITGYSYAASSVKEWGASVSTGGGTAAAALSSLLLSSSGVLMKNRTHVRMRSLLGSSLASSLGPSCLWSLLVWAVVMAQEGF